jgi:hypothetical protein
MTTTMMTFDLTPKEMIAARALVASCLANMGGKRPADLDNDTFTWVELEDLMDAGFSRFEAAGLIGSLIEKGFVGGKMPRNEPTEAYVTDAGYRWLDTVWGA